MPLFFEEHFAVLFVHKYLMLRAFEEVDSVPYILEAVVSLVKN